MRRVIVVVIFLLAPFAVFGNSVHIEPGPEIGQDTYGSQTYPYSNYGDEPAMLVSSSCRAFLRFTQLDEYIGYEITQARLNIQIYVGLTSVWRFHRVLEPWDEDTLTWENQPDHSSSEYCSESASEGDYTMVIDVTWMVRKWLDEEWENFGWCIKGSWNLQIYTSNSGCACPVLIIEGPDLPPIGVQPASLGKIKSLFGH